MLVSRRAPLALWVVRLGHRVSGSSMRRRLPRSLRWALVRIFALAVAATACGSSNVGESSLEATYTFVASSRVDSQFRDLVRQWLSGDARARAALDAALEPFARRFANDPVGRTATVLRAFNALTAEQYETARDLAARVHSGPPGVNRDLAQLVLGIAERRRGNPQRALALLTPLLHKLIDDFATERLDEVLVRAALDAGRWKLAIRFIEVWVREAAVADRREVYRRLRELIRKVPREALISALVERVGSRYEQTESIDESGVVILQSIAQQLAIIAGDAKDQALAEVLLNRDRALLGPYGETVARLAVQRSRGRVLPRTIGLLASLRDPAMRRRSADVLSGMLFGLAQADYRLVARHDGGDVDRVQLALSELAAAGAAVIVAAIDPNQSEAVADFANRNALPVLMLTPDAARLDRASSFVFLLGSDPSQTTQAMANHLRDEGARVVAGFGAPLEVGVDDSRGVGLSRTCRSLPGVGELRAERVDSLLIYDGASCIEETLELAKALRARVGAGLGPAGSQGRLLDRYARLSSGVFPIDDEDERLRGWRAAGREQPSWFLALGRDAAVLAWAAVSTLTKTSDDPRKVEAQRVAAASALAAADVTLWTTDKTGFAGRRTMVRDVKIEAPTGGRRAR